MSLRQRALAAALALGLGVSPALAYPVVIKAVAGSYAGTCGWVMPHKDLAWPGQVGVGAGIDILSVVGGTRLWGDVGLGVSGKIMSGLFLGSDFFSSPAVGACVFIAPSLKERPRAPVLTGNIEGWPSRTGAPHLRVSTGIAMTFWAASAELEAGWLSFEGSEGHRVRDFIYAELKLGVGGWYELGEQSGLSGDSQSGP